MFKPEEIPKLFEKAADTAKKNTKANDPTPFIEFYQIIDSFGQSLQNFIDKYEPVEKKKPFRFKIEPIKFDGDDL